MLQPDALGAAEALAGLQNLTLSIAMGSKPDRETSGQYNRYRDELMRGPAAQLLPGFLFQCVSISSFKTFINLFHPDKPAREAFLRDAFAPAGRALSGRPTRRPAFGFDRHEF